MQPTAQAVGTNVGNEPAPAGAKEECSRTRDALKVRGFQPSAYSRGIARHGRSQCEYEAGCQWLGGLEAVQPSYAIRLPLGVQSRSWRSVRIGAGDDERL